MNGFNSAHAGQKSPARFSALTTFLHVSDNTLPVRAATTMNGLARPVRPEAQNLRSYLIPLIPLCSRKE
jgi:hypothetical protein